MQTPGPSVGGGRAWATVVLINLTEHAQSARRAGAEITGHQVYARAAVLARLGGTLVHIVLAFVTGVASWTLTHVAAHVAATGGPVLTRLGPAGVHFLLTVTACAALGAQAEV